MEYTTNKLNELSAELHRFQLDAGFTDSNITQRLMLVVSEVSEAFEAYRKNFWAKNNITPDKIDEYQLEPDKDVAFKLFFEKNIKDTVEDEIADSVIRLLAFCAENDIDIEDHIQLKMRYNALRGHKFGGKSF